MSIRSESDFGASHQAYAAREIDLAAMRRALSRRRAWVLLPTLICFLLAVAFVSIVKPRFTGEAKVIVENGETYFTRPERSDQQPAQAPDDEAVQSQVQLVLSRDIARQAIDRLGLKGNPEFDPLAHGLNPLSRLLILLGLQRDPTLVSPEDRIFEAYYDHLTAFALTKSRVISIEFTADDPGLAAQGANTIADLYLDAQSAAKREAARTAAASLSTLIEDLQRRATEAAAAADAFRSQNGLLIGTNNNTITAQQLGDITTQLAQARTAQADAQAKAKLIRDMIRENRTSEIPDIANNELIRRISEQRVSLRAEIALQSRTLLAGHPHMQELEAQLADVDNQLRAAGDKAVRTLENDAKIAADRVANLQTALDTQKKAASSAGADEVRLNALELKARLLKEQLEFNTAKYQEAVAREDAVSTPADARVISRAVPPQQPSFPKKLPLIAIVTLAGAILSIGIVIARELLSGRAFAAAEPITTLPRQVGLGPLARGALDEDDDDADRDVAWAGRVEDPLAAALAFVRSREIGSRATRILLLAPNLPASASQATLGLARLLARDARSILVDLDAVAPAVPAASLAVIDPGASEATPAGISDLLLGDASFAEVIHRDRASRLHVVPVGRMALDGAAPSHIGPVLDALSETYDVVLLHTPAGEHALTRVLAQRSDAAMILVGDGSNGVEAGAARDGLARVGLRRIFLVPTTAMAVPAAEQDAA